MAKYQGFFKPKNPQKYKGDPTNIVYRSGWELRLMLYLDDRSDIINWSSEEIIIPYRSPIDNKIHRYFPDFKVTKINKDGKKETAIIEVKPLKETKMPELPKKQTPKVLESYMYSMQTYKMNLYKWAFAKDWCEKRHMKFVIITEQDLKNRGILK